MVFWNLTQSCGYWLSKINTSTVFFVLYKCYCNIYLHPVQVIKKTLNRVYLCAVCTAQLNRDVEPLFDQHIEKHKHGSNPFVGVKKTKVILWLFVCTGKVTVECFTYLVFIGTQNAGFAKLDVDILVLCWTGQWKIGLAYLLLVDLLVNLEDVCLSGLFGSKHARKQSEFQPFLI